MQNFSVNDKNEILEYIFSKLSVQGRQYFVTWHIAKGFTADISIETTMYNRSDTALLLFYYQLSTPFIPPHLKLQLLWNDSCLWCWAEQVCRSELPGARFAILSFQSIECIGLLINKTWGTVIQMKGILISSSSPLRLLWPNARTEPRPIGS